MKILYLGVDAPHSTSLDRIRTLRRLGHQVRVLNPESLLPASRWLAAWHFRTGYRGMLRKVLGWLRRELGREFPDLIWVGGGRVLGPEAVQWLKTRSPIVLNYNNDDPFGIRDGRCWDAYRAAVPYYDLLALPRMVNIPEALAAGAKRVIRFWMTYDDQSHAPLQLEEAEAGRWTSSVVFVGTWMPERGPFLLALKQRQVPLSIYGNRWQKAPEWKQLRDCWRGPGALGRDYVKAIQGSLVCLGLVSKGNRDLHTRRSVEAPFMGGALCAERTSEHRMLYAEGREALFWSNAEECAGACQRLLNHAAERKQMALAGQAKVRDWDLSNDALLRLILEAACASVASSPAVMVLRPETQGRPFAGWRAYAPPVPGFHD